MARIGIAPRLWRPDFSGRRIFLINYLAFILPGLPALGLSAML